MGSRITIFKNTIALAVPNVLNPFISFALILIISRYSGVSGLGEYSLVLAYIGIFGTLASLGLADLVVREVARKPGDIHLYLFNAGVFGIVSSSLAIAVMNLMILSMKYPPEVVQASFIASFSLVASTGITYLEAIFRSVERSKYIALTFVIENAVKVSVSIMLLLNGFGIPALFIVVVAARFSALALLSYFYMKVLGKPGLKFDRKIFRNLASEAPTFTSIAIFSTIHLSLDSIMLSKLKSLDAVGIYSSADRLLTICKTVPTAFAAALLPFFTRERQNGLAALKNQVETTLRYLSILLIPIVVGTFVLADQFILLIYGNKFATAGQVLRFHIISLIPFSTVFMLAQVLIATDNQRVDLMINIVAAVANFTLNLILIPPYAEMGAVLATLGSIVIFNELQYYYVRKRLFSISFSRVTLKPLAAGLLMGVVTYLLSGFHIAVNILISACVYFTAILLFKLITRNDVAFLCTRFPGGPEKD